MRTQEFLIAGLAASRGTNADTMTANIGESGLSEDDLNVLAEKWALEAWTNYDPEDSPSALTTLLEKNIVITPSENRFSISDAGRSQFKAEVKEKLSGPKSLDQFNLGLAFRGLLSDDEYKECLAQFKINLDQSIKGNGEKFSHMTETPFAPLVSLIMTQMLATQAWLENELK